MFRVRGKALKGTITALLAAAVLLLSACGSESQAPSEGANASSTEADTPTGSGNLGSGKSKRRDTDEPAGNKKRKRGDESKTPGGGSSKSGDTGAPTRPQGCPPELDDAACEAYVAGAKASQRLDDDECYSSLSKKQCRELGKALEGSGSRTLDDDECPSALTSKQCKELGRALKKASSG